MKKHILLACITLLMLANSCLGQFASYYHFPSTNARWSEVYTNNALESYYYNYYMDGDTMVNNKIYYILRRSGGYDVHPNGWQSYDTVYCLLREDTIAKKVYACFNPAMPDTLLYDFNLHVNDTLPVSYLTNLMYPTTVVTSIDSILIGTHYRKKFVLKNIQFPYWQDSLIEGIGSTTGLMEPIPWIFEHHSTLLCFKQNDTTVYPFLNDSCQVFVQGTPTINQKRAAVIIYPNPNNGKFNVQLSDASGKSLVEVYNMLGEKVYSQTFNTQNSTVNIGSQPAGVYLYRVTTQTGKLLSEGKFIKE